MKILLISLLFVLSSFSQVKDCPGSQKIFKGECYSESEYQTIEDFNTLVEETNLWRSAAIDFLIGLAAQPDKIITSEELSRIHNNGTLKYRDLRENFYKYINKVKYMSEIKTENVYFLEDQKSGEFKSDEWFYESFKDGNFLLRYLLSPKCSKLNLDLCAIDGRNKTLDFKLALASAFILYDNYTLVFAQFDNLSRKSKLDQIINSDNAKIKDFLKEVEEQYSSYKNYASMVRTVETYEKIMKQMDSMSIYTSSFEKYVDATIQSSYLYNKRKEISSEDVWKLKRKFAWKWIKNKFNYRTSKVTNGLSKAFGNTVGLVATRKGKLLDMKESSFSALIGKLKSQLKPMDILLEKTPFRLTDKFIPGHWGHVAVWVGTETELKSMVDSQGKRLWDYLNPEFQKDVQNGKNIIEALRPGVQVNSLEHFMNIDDLAIVRPNFMPESQTEYIEKLKYYLIRANEQYGKDYDFNFDVETDKTIVCSEITYVIFTDKELKWPLDKAVGRYTISPDHVAQRATSTAIEDSKYSFTPVVLYHDGKEVNSSKVQRVFERLLDGDYDNL